MAKLKYSIVLIIVTLLLIIHFLIGIDTINHLSPTYDEPVHLTVGYFYLRTGNYKTNLIYNHPPVAEMYAATPLLFIKPILPIVQTYKTSYPEYAFADNFIYHNKVDAEKLINSARIMTLLLSCLLGFIVYLWAKQLYGIYSGILALVLYVFNSNFIAYGTLVTTDLAVTLFCFLSVYIFWRWLNNQRIKTIFFLALSTVLALTTKFSGIITLGIYMISLLLPSIRKKIKLSKKQFIYHISFFLFLIAILLFIIYRFKFINLYWEGLNNILKYIQTGKPTFLFGQHSTTGWIYYFIITFLLKTPIPLLVLMAICLIVNRKKTIDTNTIILLLPAIVYFIIASTSKVQIGLRHIMYIYPFIFVWVSGIISNKNMKLFKISYPLIFIFCFLVIWYTISCIKIHPWHISYFNEFVGNPKNGYKYLTDSNIDWGQGLKELGKWRKSQDLKGIYLCYFGTGDPHYYGIKYIPGGMATNVAKERRTGDNIVFSPSDRIFFAISATNLQATYYKNKKALDWLKKYEPDEIIAYSIFVYELTKNQELLKDFKKFW